MLSLCKELPHYSSLVQEPGIQAAWSSFHLSKHGMAHTCCLTCVYVLWWMHMCVWHVHFQVHTQRPEQVSSLLSLPHCLETGSLSNLKLTHWLSWLTSNTHLPVPRRYMQPFLAFYLTAGDANSGSHVCRVSFLPNQPSPKTVFDFLKI